MNAGQLRERITIQKEVKTSTPANQKIGDWEDVCTIWAEARCTDSTLTDGDGFVVHAATWKFYIRRRDDIKAGMRIKWKDRIFLMEGPPIDWAKERTGLTLIAKEIM